MGAHGVGVFVECSFPRRKKKTLEIEYKRKSLPLPPEKTGVAVPFLTLAPALLRGKRDLDIELLV